MSKMQYASGIINKFGREALYILFLFHNKRRKICLHHHPLQYCSYDINRLFRSSEDDQYTLHTKPESASTPKSVP